MIFIGYWNLTTIRKAIDVFLACMPFWALRYISHMLQYLMYCIIYTARWGAVKWVFDSPNRICSGNFLLYEFISICFSIRSILHSLRNMGNCDYDKYKNISLDCQQHCIFCCRWFAYNFFSAGVSFIFFFMLFT